ALVDAANIASLRHLVPIGAHDIDSFVGDIEVRPASGDDSFVPFGSSDPEAVPRGELVYVSGTQVRTRRWVWRQSEIGKISGLTRRVFFPVDGFAGKTDAAVKRARDDLAALCGELLGAAVRELWVDARTPGVVLLE
ncbi:MAG: phenylalanine--tRNA ligase beta subunit-related protein, partial [Firmicutes bacterium]|nr:phenylalanine--tRNA ligase beta subunit-related protein [Bacillota bacterium]